MRFKKKLLPCNHSFGWYLSSNPAFFLYSDPRHHSNTSFLLFGRVGLRTSVWGGAEVTGGGGRFGFTISFLIRTASLLPVTERTFTGLDIEGLETFQGFFSESVIFFESLRIDVTFGLGETRKWVRLFAIVPWSNWDYLLIFLTFLSSFQ